MDLDNEVLKEIIRARLARTIAYLQRFSKGLPRYLLHLRHKFKHPIKSLQILIQQLSPTLRLDNSTRFQMPEGGIPEEVDYFDLASNELRTALIYFQQRKNNKVFEEIQDYYLEQKLTKIISDLEEIRKDLP